jgi:hypothetical protein
VDVKGVEFLVENSRRENAACFFQFLRNVSWTNAARVLRNFIELRYSERKCSSVSSYLGIFHAVKRKTVRVPRSVSLS